MGWPRLAGPAGPNMKKIRGLSLLLFLLDFFLLTASFFLVHYWEQRSWALPDGYRSILIDIYIFWLPIFFLAKKHRPDIYRRYRRVLLIYIKSAVFLVYGLSFLVVFFSRDSTSRLQVFGTCLVWLVLECLLLTVAFLGFGKRWNHQPDIPAHPPAGRHRFSPFLIFSDFVLFTLTFFLVNFLRRATFRLPEYYPELFVLYYGLWAALSVVTKKYELTNFRNLYFALAACIKTSLFMGAVVSVVIFAFRLFYFSRLQVFGTLLLLLFLECVLYFLYFLFRLDKKPNGDIESIEGVHRFLGQEDLPPEAEAPGGASAPLPSHMKILMDICGSNYPRLFEFIRGALDLSSLSDSEIALLDCQDNTCVGVLKDGSLRLAINFQRVNDIRWLNRFLLEVHKKLKKGGYFVGRVESLELHKEQFFRRYPRYYRELFYLFYFLFHRVMPRLPQTKAAYFTLTKGRNQSLSRAETLGRLYFCGFKVLAEQENQDGLFFIAQKTKTPSLDESPSYSPIIKLKRVGWNGQRIEIYKIRTMHPYSEYLQEYAYEQHRLKEGGKIKDDFRVTEWGRFFRKYWLDELPMVYNWLRGEIKLFGVRPLSRHYLSLYDSSVQELRMQIKPGLIPPYYADLPKGFRDIVESEKRYLRAYRRHPWKTQCVYFFKSLNNILLKGARSE
jgi:Ca2+/Na+ antiporter